MPPQAIPACDSWSLRSSFTLAVAGPVRHCRTPRRQDRSPTIKGSLASTRIEYPSILVRRGDQRPRQCRLRMRSPHCRRAQTVWVGFFALKDDADLSPARRHAAPRGFRSGVHDGATRCSGWPRAPVDENGQRPFYVPWTTCSMSPALSGEPRATGEVRLEEASPAQALLCAPRSRVALSFVAVGHPHISSS